MLGCLKYIAIFALAGSIEGQGQPFNIFPPPVQPAFRRRPSRPWPTAPTSFTMFTPPIQPGNDGIPPRPWATAPMVTEGFTPTLRMTYLVKGFNATPGDYPFMAFIELDNGESRCGGTILSREWILTAAHCFDEGKTATNILLGAVRNDGTDPNGVNRKMKRKCCHKHYYPPTLLNDICLVKLSSPVTYGEFIQSVKLPPPNSKSADGTTATAMGWGNSSDNKDEVFLQVGNFVVINKRQCETWYDEDYVSIPRQHFCAGHRHGGTDTCDGDSGGPLVVKEDGFWVVRGITSFGALKCGIAKRPGVFTRVSSHVEWIRNKMERPCIGHSWESWSSTCSVTCGKGTEKKTRECRDEDGQTASSINCQGSAQQQKACTKLPCKAYAWGTWSSSCSVTCGMGTDTRIRQCLDQDGKVAQNSFCSPGDGFEQSECHPSACENYSWGEWSSLCSMTCGKGVKTKRRRCFNAEGNRVASSLCSGNAEEWATCLLSSCKQHSWGPWSSTCSVTCGKGTEKRTRECGNEDGKIASTTNCKGSAQQQKPCTRPPCKDYSWGKWSSSCSVTCGKGVKTKRRRCFNADRNRVASSLCSGNAEERGTCLLSSCKRHSWGPWSSTCSVTCGKGTEKRTRECRDEDGKTASITNCQGSAQQQKPCTRPPCKAYAWGTWSSSCSVTCGTGTDTRIRQCLDQDGKVAQNSFCSPGDGFEHSECHPSACENYSWGKWSSSCSVTCGKGVQTKRRRCINADRNRVASSLCSGNAEEQETCLLSSCKPIYKWGSWKKDCSVTCGQGTETRKRMCLDQNGNTALTTRCAPGKSLETGNCQRPRCIGIDSNVYSWGRWTKICMVTCGQGDEMRRRECLDQNKESASLELCSPGRAVESGLCHHPPCTESNYQWGPWQGACSVTCGNGVVFRTRKCFNSFRVGVQANKCSGSQHKIEICALSSCGSGDLQSFYWGPWKTWSSCRTRTTSANPCNGFTSTTRDCMRGGLDVAPQRCIATIGEDFYKEVPCRPPWC